MLFETLHYFRLLEINKKFFFGLAKRFPGKKRLFLLFTYAHWWIETHFNHVRSIQKNEFELDMKVYDISLLDISDSITLLWNKGYVRIFNSILNLESISMHPRANIRQNKFISLPTLIYYRTFLPDACLYQLLSCKSFIFDIFECNIFHHCATFNEDYCGPLDFVPS